MADNRAGADPELVPVLEYPHGPAGNLTAIFDPEPQRSGGITRRAVAKRRSRTSGLTRPAAEDIAWAFLQG